MIERTVIDDKDVMVGGFPEIPTTSDKLTGTVANALTSAIKALITKVNGLISLGTGESGHRAGNLDAQYIDVLTPSVANTEFSVPHGLKRVIIGYDVVRRDRAAHIYDSSYGSWDDQLIFLKCDVASATVRLRVY